MTRHEHIESVLNEFCSQNREIADLTIETVWNQDWDLSDAINPYTKMELMYSPGVYFFVDYCTEHSFEELDADGIFTVIRRIGKAKRMINDRMKKYCHNVEGVYPRYTYWKDRTKRIHKWFRYAQIDIVRTKPDVAHQLEKFLLTKIPTHENIQGVPKLMRHKPRIYQTTTTQW